MAIMDVISIWNSIRVLIRKYVWVIKMENEILIDKLTQHMLHDLAKDEIDDFTRAETIKRYMERLGYSQRDLAKETGISRGTIDSWLQWNKIEKEDYKELREKGHTKKEIRQMIRSKGIKTIGQKDVLKNRLLKYQEYFINIDKGILDSETINHIGILIGILENLTKENVISN